MLKSSSWLDEPRAWEVHWRHICTHCNAVSLSCGPMPEPLNQQIVAMQSGWSPLPSPA